MIRPNKNAVFLGNLTNLSFLIAIFLFLTSFAELGTSVKILFINYNLNLAFGWLGSRVRTSTIATGHWSFELQKRWFQNTRNKYFLVTWLKIRCLCNFTWCSKMSTTSICYKQWHQFVICMVINVSLSQINWKCFVMRPQYYL